MSEPFSMADLDSVGVTMEEPAARESDPEAPFRVALLGDWSGRPPDGRGAARPAAFTPTHIDRDNFDEVMARLGVGVRAPLSGSAGDPAVELRFESLYDFHPDRIFERAEAFQSLRALRRGLEEPATFADAAEEVRRRFGLGRADDATPADTTPAPTHEADAGSLLDRMLEAGGGADRGEPKRPAPDDDLSALLREAVRPHLVSVDLGRQEESIAAVDKATGRLMRAFLQHPHFKTLEAAWRSVHFLASRLETGAELKLYLLDVPKAELATELDSARDLRETRAYKLFVEQSVATPGGEPWALIAADYVFDRTREDVLTLIRLAQIASRAGAPFVAAASPRVLGCESLAETPDPEEWRAPGASEGEKAWGVLRSLPDSSYLGLALPRFLLRLPYGASTEPAERFEFEEADAAPAHEDYLWGNPAFACAYLLARTFSLHGWDMRPGDLREIEGLPVHIREGRDGAEAKPCAEVLLTMSAAEAILDRGVMPLLSFKGRDTVRLARFQSISTPATPLAGRWD